MTALWMVDDAAVESIGVTAADDTDHCNGCAGKPHRTERAAWKCAARALERYGREHLRKARQIREEHRR